MYPCIFVPLYLDRRAGWLADEADTWVYQHGIHATVSNNSCVLYAISITITLYLTLELK